MNALLNTAIEAAIKAGDAILEIYESGDFNVDMKSDDSPLTQADIASHQVIMEFLQHTDIPVLSEEGKSIPYNIRKNWDKLWIVDPLDGTKEFIKRNGEFTVNIALIDNGQPILGVVYTPVTETLYYASEKGSYKIENAKKLVNIDVSGLLWEGVDSIKLPIKSSRKNYTVVASRSHMSPETEQFISSLEGKHGNIELISKGSSLKICLVAEGAADCYPRFAPTMEWDIAAGHAICRFAGVPVIDQKTGVEMIYNREELLNNWFLIQW